jgi:uncharacterized protein (DUF2384 family)
MSATRIPTATGQAELTYQLAHPSAAIIWSRAVEVFGNEAKARAWMDTRLPILDGHTPREHAESGSIERQREVLEILVRIDFGMFE